MDNKNISEQKEKKITDCICELGEMIDDWATVQTSEIEEQAERLIIAKAAELVKLAEPKKSEMACNCCGDCGETRPLIYAQTEDIDAINKVVDFLLAEMSKLANQKKF